MILKAVGTVTKIGSAPAGLRMIEIMLEHHELKYKSRLPIVMPRQETDGIVEVGDKLTITIEHRVA